jgi:tetratricopeptide (TPR) repeat protein
VEAPRRLVEEHTLLARVIHQLRVEGRAADALSALDDYDVRYPAGSLAPEAAALRAETLLELGRKPEAIRTLSELLARPLPGNEERRVLRGELLASMGSWRGASADFDQALLRADEDTPDSRPRSSLVERALWGRAVARNHLGEGPGSRADLAAYLRRFPRGVFAVQAARALDRSP